MPGPQLTAFAGDERLPAAVDVAVIGGGVIGVFTALALAERGVRVLIVEKGEIGGEQSSRNWGWVRIAMRDMREVPLMRVALALWDGMEERLQAPTGFTRSGISFACETPAALDGHQGWLEAFRDGGHDQGFAGSRSIAMMRGPAMADLFPGLSTRASAMLYSSIDGRAEPQWVAPAAAEAARRRGAAIVTACAVLGLDWQNGRVCGIETERGHVRCQTSVLAGGIWSSSFARIEGFDIPQLRVLNTVLRTSPADGGPQGALWTDRYAFRRRADGGFTIASAAENIVEIVPDSFRHLRRFTGVLKQEWKSLRPRVSRVWLDDWLALPRGTAGTRDLFRKYRTLDPTPAAATVDRAFRRLKDDYPLFRPLRVEQQWAGMIDVTPDAVPVISPVAGRDGLILATGFSGHGFGISPAAGRLAADLVTGATPVVDPHAFRLSRFTDGSPITITGGV